MAVVVDKLHVDAGKRWTDIAGAARAVHMDCAVHDRFGQAVAFHDALAGRRLDPMEIAHRKRRRARHQHSRTGDGLARGRVAFGQVGQRPVHRGDAEHHGRARGQLVGHGLGREPADMAERTTDPKRPHDTQDEAVDVEQRQAVGQHIVRCPCPDLGQRVEVRGHGPAGNQHALGGAGGPGRVEDERRTLVVRLDGHGRARRIQVDRHPRDSSERLGQCVGFGRDQDGRRAVADHVVQVAGARLRIDRNNGRPPQDGCHHSDARLQRRRGPYGNAIVGSEAYGQGRSGVPKLPVGKRTAAHAQGLPIWRVAERRDQHAPRRMPLSSPA